jgi:hypothetical protein
VVPGESPPLEETARLFDDLRREVSALQSEAATLPALDGRIAHPLLGAFTASQWIRFARVHVDHHLAIVRDIWRKVGL